MISSFCVYCGAPATTRDHVPPKCLLEKPYPTDLPTVPSCKKCNSSFSLDEQYFLILLAATTEANPAILRKVAKGGVIERTLERSPRLDERLLASLNTDNDGRIIVLPEFQRVNRILQKIGLGCFVLKYGHAPKLQELLPVTYPHARAEEQLPELAFMERLRSKRWSHVQRGVFSYIIIRGPWTSRGLCCVMDFYEAVWGIVLLSNENRFRRSKVATPIVKERNLPCERQMR